MTRQSNRLVSIDVLRAVAVLAVLARHLPFSQRLAPSGGAAAGPGVPALPASITEITHYGEFGVHLFLVISGFCIHMSWARASDGKVAFGAFWRRRLRRLYPPYFVALIFSLLGLYMLFGAIGGGHGPGIIGYRDWSQFAIDLGLLLLLAHNINGAYARIGNGPFWSLALEEQLYMLYFPLLHLRRRIGWTGTLLIVLVATMAWRTIGTLLTPTPGFWFVLGPAHWFSWALGALAVEAHLGRLTLPAWARSFAGFGVLLVAAVLVHPSDALNLGVPGARVLDDLLFGCAFFVLVNAAGQWERAGRLGSGAVVRALAAVGVWSYSIYLTHDPVMAAMKQVGLRLGFGTPGVLMLRATAAVLVGYVFYRIVERRFLNTSKLTPTDRANMLAPPTPLVAAEPASSPSTVAR